jgi:H+-transporting ATPase
MAPLGWGWAGFVWGYALIWALVTDPVKVLAYHLIDPLDASAKPKAPITAQPAAAAATA